MDDIPEGLVEAVVAAIHDGLGGDGWAYSNYGGDERLYCRAELLAASRAAILAQNAWLAEQAPFDGGKLAHRVRKQAQRR